MNSQILIRMTDRSVREETRSSISNFDIVKNIRVQSSEFEMDWEDPAWRSGQSVVSINEVPVRHEERWKYGHGYLS